MTAREYLKHLWRWLREFPGPKPTAVQQALQLGYIWPVRIWHWLIYLFPKPWEPMHCYVGKVDPLGFNMACIICGHVVYEEVADE